MGYFFSEDTSAKWCMDLALDVQLSRVVDTCTPFQKTSIPPKVLYCSLTFNEDL